MFKRYTPPVPPVEPEQNAEKKLLCAMIERAVLDYLIDETGMKKTDNRIAWRKSAQRWLFAEREQRSTDSLPFSYVCELLNFNMKAIQKVLKQQKARIQRNINFNRLRVPPKYSRGHNS